MQDLFFGGALKKNGNYSNNKALIDQIVFSHCDYLASILFHLTPSLRLDYPTSGIQRVILEI